MCETIGTRKIMFVFFALQGILVLMLFWTHDVWMFYLFAIVFGIGYGGETGGFPILNRQYYGQAPTGAPHGWQMAGAGLGMALGGWIGGPIFDIFGSYDIALWASIATSLAGALNIVFLEPTHSLLIPDWEAEEASESEESPDPEESPQPRIASGD